MKYLAQLALILMFLIMPLAAWSQENEETKPVSVEEVKAKTESLGENVAELQTDVAGLKKIKVSGYIQINYEKTENAKGLFANPYYGKDDEIQSRFRVRRSRLKVVYDGGLTEYVLQGDFSNGGFTIKDAYLEFKEPWKKLFALKAGVFNRPMYEVEYSSSQRESMERSTLCRTLYPDERDLGAMITFHDDDLFKLQLAGFNNTFKGDIKQPEGPYFNTEPLYFMARITKSLDFKDLGMALDFGAHARFGNVETPGDRKYVFASNQAITGNVKKTDLTALDAHSKIGRNWFGVEAQFYWDFLGGMKLMGEYIMGSDLNEFNDQINVINGPADTTKNVGVVRKRDFNGFYVMLVKNIGTDFQVAAKYDAFNPNTALTSDEKTNKNELAVNTLGFGIHNYSFTHIRLSLWYDINKTATTTGSLNPTSLPANLLTFRAQVKF